MRTRPAVLLALLVSFAALPGWAQRGPSVLLKNVNIVGTDGKIQEHVDVSLVGDVIENIGPNLSPAKNQTVIDKSGKFVIPGLIDTRVQISSSPGNRINRGELAEEQRIAWMHSLLKLGVTTARFVQGDLTEQAAFKHFRSMNLLNSPWIVVSGPTFTAPQGNPANLYDLVATKSRVRETYELHDDADAIEKSRDVAHNGGDIFEINYSIGPKWTPAPRLNDDLLAMITKEAHGHELRAFCWVGTNAEAKTAIDKGCDVLQGLAEEVADADLVQRMAAKKIAFVPSLIAQGYLMTELTAPEALFPYLRQDYVAGALSPLMKKSFESGSIQIGSVRASLKRLVPEPPPPAQPQAPGAEKPQQGSTDATNSPAAESAASKSQSNSPAAESATFKPQSNSPSAESATSKPQSDSTAPVADNEPRPTVEEALRDQQKRARENVKKMSAAGVPVVVGTGAGALLNIPGASEHLEMQLLVDAGLTPLQALQAATSNAAFALGKPKDFGSIEKGKLADVLVLDANPLENIHNTTKINMVIRGGWIVNTDNPAEY